MSPWWSPSTSTKLEPFTSESGGEDSDTGLERSRGRMELFMKVSGEWVKPSEKANSRTPKERSITANGLMIKLMDTALTFTQIKLGTKAIGSTTCKTVVGSKLGQTVLYSKDNTKVVKKVD